MDRIADIAGAIITLAIIATLVNPKSKTSDNVKALGSAFTSAIKAATYQK